jgi:hypothetical protein
MKTIKGHCITSVYGYEMIITEFYRIPKNGELVRCLYNGKNSTLRVFQIVHDIKDEKPYIIVELIAC